METKLTAKDFASGLPVKWCPGCGDFGLLTMIQRTMSQLNVAHEKYTVISGIGCSSRLPYYLNTYGFHSIHGRAIAIASGVKLANRELFVWVITGDGDGLSIGGNHMIHAIRRNIDLKTVMFNNRIYALTKGQASPTTLQESKTKTTPSGNPDYPINPVNFAISIGCCFVARGVDNDINYGCEILQKSAFHRGFSFIEMIQKCVVFTDKEFDIYKDPKTKDEMTVKIEHGKPMIFGKNRNKAIVIKKFEPEIIEFDPANPPKDLTVYDSTSREMAYIVSSILPPDFPLPLGIFINSPKKTMQENYADILQPRKNSISDYFLQSETYEIK